jgi:glycosyltransferase involved in cell wall biosynthesis
MRIGGLVVAPGINLIGHLSTNLGLGVAARNTAQLLAESDVEFCAVDVHTAAFAANQSRDWESYYWGGAGAAPFSVNLFHLNPPEIRAEMRLAPSWVETEGRLNACVPFWELSRIPDDWLEYIAAMDVVLAPTRFVADVVKRSAPSAQVMHFPQTVYLPQRARADRSRWGFADDSIVFVSSFDINSDPARKNPWGAIDAFVGAGDSLPASARLVVKVNNPSTKMAGTYAEQLRRAVAVDSRISLMEDSLSYADVLSLYASADVFISLHRSEGLGLGLLESMMLGTPVIATGYSGNMDFTTAENSRLVGYDLVPASTDDPRSSYAARRIGEGQMWAEPKLEQASQFMVQLAENPAELADLGEAAQQAALSTQRDPERIRLPAKLVEMSQGGLSDGAPFPEYGAGEVVMRRVRRGLGRAMKSAGLR